MENEITKAYELGFIPNPKDYRDLTFEERFTPSKSKLLNDDLVYQKINEGIKVASVYLPKRILNPEENKSDVNDFFNSLDGISICEFKR